MVSMQNALRREEGGCLLRSVVPPSHRLQNTSSCGDTALEQALAFCFSAVGSLAVVSHPGSEAQPLKSEDLRQALLCHITPRYSEQLRSPQKLGAGGAPFAVYSVSGVGSLMNSPNFLGL